MQEIKKYIETIKTDIEQIKNQSDINCCDAREIEVLESTIYALIKIPGGNKND